MAAAASGPEQNEAIEVRELAVEMRNNGEIFQARRQEIKPRNHQRDIVSTKRMKA